MSFTGNRTNNMFAVFVAAWKSMRSSTLRVWAKSHVSQNVLHNWPNRPASPSTRGIHANHEIAYASAKNVATGWRTTQVRRASETGASVRVRTATGICQVVCCIFQAPGQSASIQTEGPGYRRRLGIRHVLLRNLEWSHARIARRVADARERRQTVRLIGHTQHQVPR